MDTWLYSKTLEVANPTLLFPCLQEKSQFERGFWCGQQAHQSYAKFQIKMYNQGGALQSGHWPGRFCCAGTLYFKGSFTVFVVDAAVHSVLFGVLFVMTGIDTFLF